MLDTDGREVLREGVQILPGTNRERDVIQTGPRGVEQRAGVRRVALQAERGTPREKHRLSTLEHLTVIGLGKRRETQHVAIEAQTRVEVPHRQRDVGEPLDRRNRHEHGAYDHGTPGLGGPCRRPTLGLGLVSRAAVHLAEEVIRVRRSVATEKHVPVGTPRQDWPVVRKWLIQVSAALATCMALLAFYEVADVDTNIDTGNTVAIGLVELALVWLVVAVLGTVTFYVLHVVRRRR